MDEKDWIALKTVVEERSITKAAERLYLSQPALTYRLKNLEKEFGVPLFSRRPAGALFTEQGEYLLHYAEEMLAKLGKTKEHVRSMGGKVQGTLRLGSSTTFAQWCLAPLLKSFKEQYPLVEIYLRSRVSSHLINLLREQEVSVAIIRGDIHWPENRHLLQEEALCLVSATPIDMDELPNLPWIQYDIDFLINATDEDWWREHFSVPPLTNIKVDKIDTCLQMVLHGLGWTILPEIWLRNHPSLHAQPMFSKSGAALTRKTWMLYKTEALERAAVKAFIEHMAASHPAGVK
ncbi:MAG TPA: LysR family transcriptional regulator [Selenomonadales bacterium]|nr:LysR family transcriptional regulator [Selenomonadales bacterium]